AGVQSLPTRRSSDLCGVVVPMIAGRGLGHTGGTIDKLEAIPGYRTQLTVEEFRRQLARCGVAIAAQTEELAPADRKHYALRDARSEEHTSELQSREN